MLAPARPTSSTPELTAPPGGYLLVAPRHVPFRGGSGRRRIGGGWRRRDAPDLCPPGQFWIVLNSLVTLGGEIGYLRVVFGAFCRVSVCEGCCTELHCG